MCCSPFFSIKDSIEQILSQNPESKLPLNFPWRNFADFAYKNKVKLLNWPEKAPIPSKDLRDIKSDLNSKMLQGMVHPRDHEAGIGCQNEVEVENKIDEGDNDSVCVVQWNEGMLLILSFGFADPIFR